MTPKLELPAGAHVGSILEVTHAPSKVERLIPGTHEGKLLGIKGNRITVRFIYLPACDYDPPEETLVINLETGMDETNHAPISDIELKTVV